MKNIQKSVGKIVIWTTIGKTVIGVVIALFFIRCKEKTSNMQDKMTESNLVQLPVAYVDADSLLTHFDFYNDLLSAYENKVNTQHNFLNSNYQKLQNEAVNFQQKIQNNAFLTQEKMTQEQVRIQNMQENLQKKANQVEQELALEQKQIQQQLSDSLSLGINEFNTPQKYQMIFTKTGNMTILYADKHYNITNEVIEFLNKRFKSETK